MGCDAVLPQPELTEHENSSSPKHLELFAIHITQLGLLNARLHRQLQDAQSEVDTVKQQLSLCSRENDLLKQQLAQLQNSQQQSEEHQSKVVAGLKSRIEQMTGQIHVLEGKSSQELVQVRGKCSQLEERLNESGSRAQMDVGLPEDVRKKFISHDRTIGQHDVRLAELDLRLQCTETANYEGVLIWKISEYADRKRQASEGRILSLYSQPFYTSRYGYKMCARVYLNGDGVGRGTHLSLFFVVMQGDYDDILAWPFRQKVTLTLIDQRTNRRHQSDMFRPDPTSSSFQKPTSPMNIASGCPLFVSHEVLEDQREGLYLRNNSIFLKVVVDTSDLLNP
jgi:TNF receptor-associated factor 3